MKTLNSLVTEILSITEFPRKPHGKWTFTNPRDGWVFITSTANTKIAERVHVALNSVLLVHQATAPDTLETMRYLPAGEYELLIVGEYIMAAFWSLLGMFTGIGYWGLPH